MSETRKRTLEKSDSIPTEEIILGPQDENTEKTENIEGKVSGVLFSWQKIYVQRYHSLVILESYLNNCPVYLQNGETGGFELQWVG